jgi:2-dehydropantoate 2-reductase
MKVGIVGAGAMGSIFTYFFYKANISTTIFEKDKNTIKNIKNGLKLVIGDETENIKIEVSDNPLILIDCEIIFIFVKTYDTEEALKIIASVITEREKKSIIVTLQNGIGSIEKISKYISKDRIVYGSTSIGATRVNNNTVKLGGMGDIVIGGVNKDAVSAVENVFKKCRLNVLVTDKPDTAIWKKAIINAAINPIGALLGIPNGDIVKNEYSRDLQEKIVREAVEVADSMGLSFNTYEMIEQTRKVCENTSKNLCSMLQDVNAHRRTEIDSINGIIIQYGIKNNIPTPYNAAVYCLIKAKESL